MKKTKVVSLAVCSALIVSSMFAGCSKSSSSTASQGDAKSGTVTIAYEVSGTDDPIGTWLKKVAADYNKDNPNVTVKPAPITADENTYYTKLDLEMKSGSSCPDIAYEDSFLISSDVTAGYLEPITDTVNSWADWSQFNSSVKKGVTIDNQVYGVPVSTDTRGIWYNKDIFKTAGLDTEWQPKTWDDILTACKAIKEKCSGVTPFIMYNGKAIGEGTSMQCYEMLYYGTGEQLLDDSGKWIVGSDNILSTLKFIETVNKSGYGADVSMITNSQEGTIVSTQLIPQGKVAMLLDGYWSSGAWKTTMDDYSKTMGFAAMPTQKGQDPGSLTMSGGWAFSVAKNSQNKAAAEEFLKYMCNKENLESLVLAQGNLSPRTDIAEDSDYKNSNPFNEAATKLLDNAYFRPTDSNYSSVSTAIQEMVESVATQQSTPEEAMNQYASDVKDIVGEDNTVTK